MELITKSFESQCLAFPNRVDQVLATITTVKEAKSLLDKAAVMAKYAERLKSGVAVERPIALGVLKIKAKLGELLPAKAPSETGRGKKLDKQVIEFSLPTISAYRKIAANVDKLEAFYGATEDVPTQTDFIKSVTTEQRVKKEAEREIQRNKQRKAAMLEGKYGLILCDPPWQYDFAETSNREIENHYPTMTVEELSLLKPPADKDCVLLIWATSPKLVEAIEVIHAWGFSYKTHAIWDKKKIGMGYWFRGQHELLLVATRGNVSPPAETNRVSSIFTEARGKHSKKPVCVYEWIEKAFKSFSKCEMFAREVRTGWYAWGNEV